LIVLHLLTIGQFKDSTNHDGEVEHVRRLAKVGGLAQNEPVRNDLYDCFDKEDDSEQGAELLEHIILEFLLLRVVVHGDHSRVDDD
jgi:hypothetical protein